MRNWKTLKQAGLMAVLLAVTSFTALAQGGAKILKPAETSKLIPPSVFYRGQSANTQLRNSTGIKFDDGFFVLASMVDTSGYSTGIAAKYQAYLITEVSLHVAGQNLAPGAYGVGFIEGNKFVVTDLGAHEVLSTDSTADSELKHPLPLQILSGADGGFRLYAGRKYVVLSR